MRPLVSVKVKRLDRAKPVNEWQSAADQSTVAGLNAFAERQQERLRLAQERHVVLPMRKR